MLVLCFAVRALLPVGFMPEFGGGVGDTIKLVMCTGHGPVEAASDLTGKPADGETGKADADHCVFSALAQLALPSGAAAALPPPFAFLTAGEKPAVIVPPRAVGGPHVGARAPPTLS